MKPVPNWKIGEGDASARRKDGVFAAFVFEHKKAAYAVRRIEGGHTVWLSTAYKGVVRCFNTLQAAMDAADKSWPLEQHA